MGTESWLPKIERVNDYLRRNKTPEEFERYSIDEDEEDEFLISCGPFYHSSYNVGDRGHWLTTLPFEAALADREYLENEIRKIRSWPQQDLSVEEVIW